MKITSRSVWNARAPVATVGGMGQAQFFFVHHSVTRAIPKGASTEDEKAAMQELQSIAFGRGFSDISYSFASFPSGRIYEGRGWGKAGAHTLHFNTTASAVVCVGNYELQDPTDGQLQAIAELYKEGVRLGHIKRGAPLIPHRQVSATACPGGRVFNQMGEIRALAAGASTARDERGPRPMIESGDRGFWVERAQHLLERSGEDIVEDGIFGAATAACVKRFQKEQRLAVDGVIGPKTWAALLKFKKK